MREFRRPEAPRAVKTSGWQGWSGRVGLKAGLGVGCRDEWGPAPEAGDALGASTRQLFIHSPN